jgi:N-formylglutamate amidohydrolase
MSRFFLPIAFLLFLGLAPDFVAARDESKSEDFVTVQKGTLPIIVSAPHGGKKKVPDVPERMGVGVKNFAVVLDTNTAEMTEKFVAELEKRLNGKPWVVIARFERKYLDVNRARDQAYESEDAKPYYDAYHGALETACKAVKEKHGRGILLDIHGQGEFPGSIVRGTLNGKSVTLLKDRYGTNAVTGKKSILGVLEHYGYKVFPPCDADTKTKEESKYLFSGGYIVQNYGSHTGYAIDAIQLEFGSYLRERDRDKYTQTATDLAKAVVTFHDEFLKEAK